ncbi:MAG TPA: recombinase family protein [Vicinamibacterales bacterium]|nr:recombinase family protein [Vicinamibacterales bacterium]
MTQTATIYLRVSTAGQAEESVSLDAQKAKAEAWALANGYTVEGVYTDAGVSGKKASNREGLQNALAAVCRVRGALVVYRLSRLARSTKDAISIAERLEKAGADLVSLSERIDTSSASGKMVFRRLAVLAEFERDLVSERTTAALAHKRAQGERVGQIPLGYQLAADGVHLSEDAGEQAILGALRMLRSEGLSWQAIADEMNRRGITTKTGKAWTWQTARKARAGK